VGRVERRRGGAGMVSVCEGDWVAGEGDGSVSRGTGVWCGGGEDVVSGGDSGSGRSMESWGVLGRVGESSE
jgi:hypothetical protein